MQSCYFFRSLFAVTISLLVSLTESAFSQSIPVSTYNPSEYSFQEIFGFTSDHLSSPIFFQGWQAPNGHIMFRGGYGLYWFDGSHWELVHFPNPDQISAAYMNPEGQVWLGGDHNFGTVITDPSGAKQYQELVSEENGFPVPQISKVLDVYSPGLDTVYFVTQNALFYKKGKEQAWQVIAPATSFGKFRVLGKDSLFVEQRGLGLYHLQQDILELYDNQSLFRQGELTFTIEHPEGGWLLSDGKRLFRYHKKVFTPVFNEFQGALKGGTINTACWLNRGGVAIGTAAQGVFLLDSLGGVNAHITREEGLSNNGVQGLLVDRDEQLWVSTFNNVSRIDYTFPFPEVFNHTGTNGNVYTISEYQNEILVGSSTGIFRFQDGDFSQIEGVAGAVYSIEPMTDEVLFAGKFGLFTWKSGRTKLLFAQETRFVKKLSPQLIAIGGSGGVRLFSKASGDWREVKHFEEIDQNVYFIAAQGDTLYATTKDKLFIVQVDKDNQSGEVIRQLDESNGLRGRLRVVGSSKGPLFFSGYGLFKLNQDQTELIYDDKFGARYTSGDFGLFRVVEQGSDYWVVTGQFIGLAIATEGEAAPYRMNYSLRHWLPPGNIYALYPDSEGRLWVGSEEGVSCYDPYYWKKFSKPFETQIRRVLNKDSLVYFGQRNELTYRSRDHLEIALPAGDQEMTFYFTAPTYADPSRVQYWFKLEGWDHTYILYKGSENKVNYRNLSFGNYTFKVYAEDKFSRVGNEASYAFSIAPPWYFQWWAFLVYGVFLLAILVGFVLLNTRRLRFAKQKLEMLVRMRTEELNSQKRQVEKQKEEIENKSLKISEQLHVLEQKNRQIQNYNAELLDSLRYAKRLQDSIFSSSEDLRRFFPESFVYTQPKEIVGGDFCWVTRVENQIAIIAADCTGHGVPGAFMSIVGYNQLQRILTEDKISSPSEILSRLDLSLREAVTHADSTAVKDGMDIAVCMYDPENKTLRFAGAFQSIYLIRDRKLKEIKGNRYTAGVYFGATKKRFEEQKFAIEPEDTLYMVSDGIQDQFGGPNDSKLMKKGLRQVLLDIYEEPFDMQKERLALRMKQWQGGREQIDDILTVGIKF